MSIAARATSLDAFPTAPARTCPVRIRLVHAASSPGPDPPATTAPRPPARPLAASFRYRSLMRPTNLAQRAPATPPARRPGTTPPDPCPGPRSRSRWPVDRPTDAGGKRSSGMDRTFDRLVLEDCLAAKADGRAEPKSTGKTDA